MIILMTSTWIAFLLLALCVAGCGTNEPDAKQESVPEPSASSTVTPLEIAFAEGLTLDLYRPEGDGPFPTLVLIHGGGWVSGTRKELASEAEMAVRSGLAVASIDYRLAPKDLWPAQVADCRMAVRYLRSHGGELRLRTDKLAAAGVSAGGHLSMWLGFDGEPAERVQAVCSVSGIHDLELKMTPAGEGYRIVQSLLGPADPEGRAAASPLNRATAKSPPVYFIHGVKDPLVSTDHSELAAKRLKSLGVEQTLVLVPEMGHGLDLSKPGDSSAWADALKWIRSKLD